jgi:diguanylate cyclase (GGDEF)-like protein/PAS domain S-box-containing protein
MSAATDPDSFDPPAPSMPESGPVFAGASAMDQRLLALSNALLALESEADDHALFLHVATLARILTGFDRVRVCRFESAHATRVVAESVSEPPAEPPAGHNPEPTAEPAANQHAAPDLAFAEPTPARAGQVMGLPAMSIPLQQEHQVWGMITCYHRSPKPVSPALRKAATQFGRLISHKLGEQQRAGRARAKAALRKEKLQQTEQLMTSIVNTIPAMVFVKRADDLRFEIFNPAGEDLLGYRAEDLLGKNDYDFFPKDQADFFTAEDRKVLASETALEIPEEVINTASGEQRVLHTRKIAVRAPDGRALYLLGVSLDITASKASEEQIKTLAFFDPLTHLPNRRLMSDRLGQNMAASNRSGKRGALMMIDLDNFKSLNDSMGHELGDQLLIEVARRLTGCLREGDTVARQGGDEFVVILKGLHETEQALLDVEQVVNKIQQQLRCPYVLQIHQSDGSVQEHIHYCTSSIGLTLFRGSGVNEDELIKRADTAMYQAKRAGRDTYRFFDPTMQEAVMARSALEYALRNAIAEQQFVLHYQPQVDLSGQVVGAEVLVRWQHPERGLVPPLEFIPQAEETGLICQIGHFVLHTACQQLARWADDALFAGLTLAVNVSARQFSQPHFTDEVSAILRETGAPAARLKLELTESLLFEHTEDVIGKMVALKAHQVAFSLDDFGTGYSSLSYLKRLPLDQLKIDQSFVRDVLTDPNDAVIARTIVTLAHSLGLAVIAEGVENLAQRDFLADAGCQHYQGYHFCRPVPLAQFEAYVVQHNTAPE